MNILPVLISLFIFLILLINLFNLLNILGKIGLDTINKTAKDYLNMSIDSYINDSFDYLNKNEINMKNTYKIIIDCIRNDELLNFNGTVPFISNKIEYTQIFNKNYIFDYINLNITKNEEIKIPKSTSIISFGFKNSYVDIDGRIYNDDFELTFKGICLCNLKSIYVDKPDTYKNVIVITQKWSNNVFHSIIECVTKIGYLINQIIERDDIYIYLGNGVGIKYLEYLGINENRIIRNNTIYGENILYFTSRSCGASAGSLHTYNLRNKLRKKVNNMKIKKDVLLIIRRNKRMIKNEERMIDLLNEIFGVNNINIYYPDTLFRISLKYFKEAKLIIAPHGAGLSNILLCSPDTYIIEFLSDNLCFNGLAKELGIWYYGIKTELIDNYFHINYTEFKPLLLKVKSLIYD